MDESLRSLKYRYVILGSILISFALSFILPTIKSQSMRDAALMVINCISICIFPVYWIHKGLKKHDQSILSWYSKVKLNPSEIVLSSFMPELVSLGIAFLFIALMYMCMPVDAISEGLDEGRKGSISALYVFLTLVIIPICQETLFRGFLLKKLMLDHTVKHSIIISSVVFAVFHISNAISAILAGILLSIVHIKSKSLIPCVLIHFLHNLISIIIGFLFAFGPTAGSFTNPPVTMFTITGLVFLLLGGVWFVVFIKKNKIMFSLN